jgi:hypothetical protein
MEKWERNSYATKYQMASAIFAVNLLPRMARIPYAI